MVLRWHGLADALALMYLIEWSFFKGTPLTYSSDAVISLTDLQITPWQFPQGFALSGLNGGEASSFPGGSDPIAFNGG